MAREGEKDHAGAPGTHVCICDVDAQRIFTLKEMKAFDHKTMDINK